MGDDGFSAFWSRERDQLRRALALSLGDIGLATEAVDEAMMRAYQHWSRVSGYESPAAWVYRVATNWATSWLRRRRRRPTLPVEALDRPVDDRRDDLDLVGAVGRLPQHHRSIVVLRFYLDWPIERIATALDIPTGTVKSRLHRALHSLATAEEVHR